MKRRRKLGVAVVAALVDMALILPVLTVIASWHLWPPLPTIIGICYSCLVLWVSVQVADQLIRSN